MLSLCLLFALAAEPQPSAADARAPNVSTRSARLFSEPQVDADVLVGRMVMGLLGGGVLGGLSAFAIFAISVAQGPRGSQVPIIVTFAITGILSGVGVAFCEALFGRDYGRDLLDSLVVSMSFSVAAVGLLVLGFVFQAFLVPLVAVASAIMVVGPPLVVQALKSASDPGVVVARF